MTTVCARHARRACARTAALARPSCIAPPTVRCAVVGGRCGQRSSGSIHCRHHGRHGRSPVSGVTRKRWTGRAQMRGSPLECRTESKRWGGDSGLWSEPRVHSPESQAGLPFRRTSLRLLRLALPHKRPSPWHVCASNVDKSLIHPVRRCVNRITVSFLQHSPLFDCLGPVEKAPPAVGSG